MYSVTYDILQYALTGSDVISCVSRRDSSISLVKCPCGRLSV